MKKLLTVALMFAASLAAQSYAGIYNGKAVEASSKYPSGIPYSIQVTLLQAGNSLTGTLKIGNGSPIPIVSGTVSGTSLTFVTGGTGQSTAQLTANGAQLVGKMTSSSGGVYEVALTKH